jgi:hypothetical protein
MIEETENWCQCIFRFEESKNTLTPVFKNELTPIFLTPIFRVRLFWQIGGVNSCQDVPAVAAWHDLAVDSQESLAEWRCGGSTN